MMRTLEYRATFLVYMVGAVAGPMISLLVWLAVSGQGALLPYDREQLVTYYLLLGAVSLLTASWVGEYDLAEAIRLGKISPLLLRPAPEILHYVGDNLGQKAVMLPLQLPLVAVAAWMFRADLRLPEDPRAWLLFALALPMAAAVSFLLDFLAGSLAFWIQDVGGILQAKALLGAFLAGQVVPLELFPPRFSGLLRVQPFRYTLSFPLEVLIGGLPESELVRGFAWQGGYCVALWACYRLLWRYGLRAYSATGA
jgi:ABC-2 type transport system permease protein